MVQYKTEWEDKYAYSRIKKAGSLIETAGTIAYKNGCIHAPDDMYEQCVYIFEVLRSALQDHGSDLKDVVRTKVYVTDISRAAEVGKAHAEYFKGIDPVMTLVEVKGLIVPEAIVEIELTAWKNENE